MSLSLEFILLSKYLSQTKINEIFSYLALDDANENNYYFIVLGNKRRSPRCSTTPFESIG